MMTRNDAARFLSQRNDYLILTHRRPDGDTLGSAAALCRALRNAGKTAHVLENPELTPRFAFLLEGLTKETAGEQDTVICVDVASPGMLPKCAEALQEKCVLRIDHHSTATSFTPTTARGWLGWTRSALGKTPMAGMPWAVRRSVTASWSRVRVVTVPPPPAPEWPASRPVPARR